MPKIHSGGERDVLSRASSGVIRASAKIALGLCVRVPRALMHMSGKLAVSAAG